MQKPETKVNCTSTLFFARLGAIKQQELRQYCEKFGDVKDVTIITDSKTMKSKGCGFVKFVNHVSAKKCLDASQKHIDPSKKGWVVEWAKSTQIKEIDLDKFTLYITGITKEICTEEKLRNKFSKYGQIESITIPTVNGTVQYAFICFSTTEAAANALNNENGTDWDGNVLVVEYSEATESKRIRRQKASMKKLGFPTDMFPVISPICSPMISMNMGFNDNEDKENSPTNSSVDDNMSYILGQKKEEEQQEEENIVGDEIADEDILDILLSHPTTPMNFPVSKSASPFWDMGCSDGEENPSEENLSILNELRSAKDQNDEETVATEVPHFVHSLLM
ncbi:hypothetical protein ENUP19_0364G0003 [Entamoeba nuttalli]|uniref:RNA recognition motif domain containing protein n=2 Tax=Entamoeba nuttalli TaxID=412467 RepID=K2H9U1_ENTNP|nr:RNA recognition motif domain containing protein [Entamoeba nuttalli P19]EKE39364.1 RNA recognition motif domain containing protein [Entamoeba nuttalli P19]|eukprot:XP_008858307.1 RNA recognition motif domain containing protein [Entamoeba nuttalli P19]